MTPQEIMKELHDLQHDPIPNCSVSLIDDNNIRKWRATLFGPTGSPYEGGRFILDITLSDYYPIIAPVAQFMTQIYHLNVSCQGEICMIF